MAARPAGLNTNVNGRVMKGFYPSRQSLLSPSDNSDWWGGRPRTTVISAENIPPSLPWLTVAQLEIWIKYPGPLTVARPFKSLFVCQRSKPKLYRFFGLFERVFIKVDIRQEYVFPAHHHSQRYQNVGKVKQPLPTPVRWWHESPQLTGRVKHTCQPRAWI